MCVLTSFADFAGPIAINRLLAYMENEGADAKYRPFVWIALLFIGT
jgi:hypothetical protein